MYSNPLTSRVVPPTVDTTVSSNSAPQRSATSEPPAATEFLPSVDRQVLLQQLQGLPDVRADRVAEVMARMQSGQYSTDAAATATAEAIINSLARG